MTLDLTKRQSEILHTIVEMELDAVQDAFATGIEDYVIELQELENLLSEEVKSYVTDTCNTRL